MSEYIFDLVAFFDKAPVAPDLRRAALQSLGEFRSSDSQISRAHV